ncbi:MAG: hypothetical protein E6P95_03180 [Candidatus Moraniibacteriota bacterium]|nr:MAG: hypothetical protein E6P95_03180 [Candidatus Moranbacteria bacterium]
MSHQKEIIIVKLGGSIVTEKSADQPIVRQSNVVNIARIFRKHFNPEKHSLVLIHGAGSFGHLHAHRYKLALGTKDHPEKIFRAIENQSLDARLNSELTQIFIKAKLPVVGMPTRTIAINNRGFLSSLVTGSIKRALEANTIPLLHGDMVFDKAWGLSVLSGDVLLAKLAQYFKVTKVFFASDVDGIFSQDPHQFKKAKLIPKVRFEKIGSSITLGCSHHKDVTGGLSKKFTALNKLPALEKIFFFNGSKTKNFHFVFDQKDFFGTIIDTRKG